MRKHGDIVRDLPEELYHAEPALSAGGAWLLANECPAVYWHSSPFNPEPPEPENGKAMDIGTAVHLAALEPDRLTERTVLVDAADWRTNAAKEARDRAYAAGLVPLLPKDRALVDRLAAALRANEYVADLLDGAETELSYFWTADGIPCKARADIVTRDWRALGDLKVSASASPLFFQRQAFNAGHFLRAAWYQEGWLQVSGAKSAYWFVVVSREEPHVVTVCKLDDQALAWGQMMMRRALELFKECRDRGSWPAYCSEPVTIGLPTWAEFSLADREAAGAFTKPRPGAAELATAIQWLAP